MADRLTSKTPTCVDEIGVKGDIADVAEFPNSGTCSQWCSPIWAVGSAGRCRAHQLRYYVAKSRPPSVGAIREAAMLQSPLALWIDSYRVCGVRRLWKPPIWERPEHGCSAG